MLARSKLNSIESKMSEALINNAIKHENFTAIIDKEKKYWKLKESIRMMNSKRLEWWIVKEVMQRKLTWLKKVKMVLMKLLIIIKLLITV